MALAAGGSSISPPNLASPVWFAVVSVVGEAEVETIVMAGQRRTGTGRTIGTASACIVWLFGWVRVMEGGCRRVYGLDYRRWLC